MIDPTPIAQRNQTDGLQSLTQEVVLATIEIGEHEELFAFLQQMNQLWKDFSGFHLSVGVLGWWNVGDEDP